ncbi:hypothetical protein NPIL_175471 [Nephila pilipes]|uniref:Uncharacterized protein n=1 Tax=Nephila pilipes TaxID=299642 RepID=A0A8X6QJS0_NEPPI|nr:hypothetical protein NPIL_175471 [Nephila pilipes]
METRKRIRNSTSTQFVTSLPRKISFSEKISVKDNRLGHPLMFSSSQGISKNIQFSATFDGKMDRDWLKRMLDKRVFKLSFMRRLESITEDESFGLLRRMNMCTWKNDNTYRVRTYGTPHNPSRIAFQQTLFLGKEKRSLSGLGGLIMFTLVDISNPKTSNIRDRVLIEHPIVCYLNAFVVTCLGVFCVLRDVVDKYWSDISWYYSSKYK